MKRLAILLIAPLWLTACSETDSQPVAPQDSASAGASTEAVASEAQQANEIFEAYFQKQLELNPIYASAIGDDRYNDRFAVTISPEWQAEALAV